MKYVGIDQIIEYVVKRLGHLEEVYLVGEYARGLSGDIIDLVFVGNIDQHFLAELVGKVEKRIKRRIRYIVFDLDSFSIDKIRDNRAEPLLLWSM